MKPFLRIAMLLLICAMANNLFAQNECASATVLTVQTNSCSSTTTATTVGATQSSQTAFASAYTNDDIWFKFTTPAGATKVTITLSNVTFPQGSPVMFYLELRDAVSGVCANSYINYNTIAETGGNWALTGLTASTEYSIRLYTADIDNLSRANFNICAFVPAAPTPPANDDCGLALPITPVIGASCSGSTAYNTLGATASGQTSGDLSGKDDDVWFTFTTGSTPAAYKFSMGTVTYDMGFGNPVIELWNTCSGSYVNWWPMASSANFGVLPASTTYNVRVYTYGTTSRINSFYPCISKLALPVNDECTNAAVVPVNTDGTFALNVDASTVNATQSTQVMAPCTIPADDDVWFKFVAPSTGAVQLNISGASETMFTSIYSGTCGTLTSRKCIYGTGDTLLSLIPNAIYYARVMTQNSNVSSAFNLAIRAIAAPVTNTTCATAATLGTTYQQGTTVGLTMNSSILACYGSNAPNKELWYSFTATSASHFIEFSDMLTLSANANSLGYRLNSGTCASLTSIKCVDAVMQNNSIITGLTVGNTYYVQVLENTYNGGPVQFATRLRVPQTPANDEYNGAGVPTLTQEPTAVYQPTTIRFSTLSLNPPSGTYTQDVWYRFYAASSSAIIAITDGLSATATNVRIALYNSDGTTIFNAGTDGKTATFSALTVGNLYYVRILNKAATTDNGTSDFKIAIYGTPSTTLADAAPIGSNCVIADGPVTSTNSGRWLHVTHQGKILASILDNAGNAMGAIVAKYYTNSAAVRSDASGIEYLDRNYEITPTIQPSNPVMVRLYFSKAEFDNMIAANDNDGNDVLWLSDLKIAKFSSVPCAATLTLAGEQLYNIASWGAFTSTVYFIDVRVPAFSSFFLKTVAGGLLPVTCSNFNYKVGDGKVQLLWSTQTEINSKEFSLQRSNDGTNFSTIANIAAAGNSSSFKNYQHIDAVKNNETVYYRLLQTDRDGKQQFICKTLKLTTTGKQQLFGNSYPNPTKDMVAIDIVKPFTGKADVQVVNMLGQVMQQQSFNLQSADTQLKVNLKNLHTGTYSIRIVTSEGVQVQQVTKM